MLLCLLILAPLRPKSLIIILPRPFSHSGFLSGCSKNSCQIVRTQPKLLSSPLSYLYPDYRTQTHTKRTYTHIHIMAKEIKRKRSIGDSLRTRCANAMHSLKQMSNAVLLHSDDYHDVDNLFESLDSEDDYKDYTDVLRKTSGNVTSAVSPPSVDMRKSSSNTKSTTESARTSTASTKSTAISSEESEKQAEETRPISGAELWEEQRAQWLKPTVPKADYQKRKQTHSLGKLAEYNEDVYLSVYRNLVVYGKPLKQGLNMVDGFKVIYTGWENTKMFERVARGGIP